ncbi:uncharacterized protein N7511_008383 [Penicillium nucicola]|uniref:uncharacterized protein n=1 Tax=Penicillium nucicola TaxID=1850975 RepID=UPI002545B8B7|nr:uncharacterized protein N7511_008383 [Penicillium nucicola]KAJ5751418.1 hypothetical protein N7511_008383 [Penicillium nucicola]
MYGALTMQMRSSNLLLPKPKTPFPNLDYNSLMRRIMAFTSPEWYNSSSNPPICPDASFASVFAVLKDSLEGLELNRFTSTQFAISVMLSK